MERLENSFKRIESKYCKGEPGISSTDKQYVWFLVSGIDGCLSGIGSKFKLGGGYMPPPLQFLRPCLKSNLVVIDFSHNKTRTLVNLKLIFQVYSWTNKELGRFHGRRRDSQKHETIEHWSQKTKVTELRSALTAALVPTYQTTALTNHHMSKLFSDSRGNSCCQRMEINQVRRNRIDPF